MAKAKVSSELASEKNAGVCFFCGRFNLGDKEICEYCGKPIKGYSEVISPPEGC